MQYRRWVNVGDEDEVINDDIDKDIKNTWAAVETSLAPLSRRDMAGRMAAFVECKLEGAHLSPTPYVHCTWFHVCTPASFSASVVSSVEVAAPV